MNFFNDIKAKIIEIIVKLKKENILPSNVEENLVSVEPPRDITHGDVASNVAMVLCKQAGMKPFQLAEIIVKELKKESLFTDVAIAGPGFINMRLNDDFWYSRLALILQAGEKYGDSEIGKNKKVNVEYVSANPTGPMHVGHARGAVYGDALASLLKKAGYDVAREYYVNDAGAQVDVLAKSLFLRYREALGENIGEIPEGFYPGEYLIAPAQKLKAKYGNQFLSMKEAEWLPIIRKFSIDEMLNLIKEDLLALGISHDVFFSERELVENGGVYKVIDEFTAQGLVYEGVLEPPKGKKLDDWEPRPQLLFKATEFGDDVDRPLKKSDGSFTYFASDIAYHIDKFKRGFTHMIDVLGADHGGYVKRMQAAVKAGTSGRGRLEVKLCQMVNLMENGEPVKMSKRAGTFVTLRDVIDAVGKGVMRFIMLTRKNDAGLDFDLAKVKEQSKDNPVFYVQYAHARCCSVCRHAEEIFAGSDLSSDSLAKSKFSCLSDEAEKNLIKMLAEMPRMIESAAEAAEPHRIAYYLSDVAAAFHGLWNKGRDDASLRFLDEKDVELSKARLALVNAVKIVIASGLKVFGVEPVEEM